MEISDALPVDAVAPDPDASVMSPVVAVKDNAPAVNVPPDVVMPLLLVKFNVLLTVKLASLSVKTPLLVLLTKALPLLVVAAAAKTVNELVAVEIAAPEAPTFPVVAVSDIDSAGDRTGSGYRVIGLKCGTTQCCRKRSTQRNIAGSRGK